METGVMVLPGRTNCGSCGLAGCEGGVTSDDDVLGSGISASEVGTSSEATGTTLTEVSAATAGGVSCGAVSAEMSDEADGSVVDVGGGGGGGFLAAATAATAHL